MPKILLVDDAAFMRMRCSKLLTENGYEVAEAENGQEAVAMYQTYRPDLVLMDITMPVMDGITATREIKNIDADAKVVMVSALGQQTMVIEAIKAGAKDFVVKPFEPDKILSTVRKFVG
ncbi:two-component system chemotaxis response regulator CheY [Symbiobacterium terraclitae]|uniref:Stage 0 sporulation protein A homolog n=1 Tax=Symbiobacterium terraclitae TaxID=557451 RepID=A0ABS4JRW9_9FIRM|nr:response regulator [Symbiobacterium terraclitae]MBP2017641.1 two-component system chemotaxis response regulator CheY [Symbiobacterium terraclitae]